jgi:hypothetical protein
MLRCGRLHTLVCRFESLDDALIVESSICFASCFGSFFNFLCEVIVSICFQLFFFSRVVS